jgi:O-antigen ligase
MIALARPAPANGRLARAFAAVRARASVYACGILVTFALAPGLRRLVDWKTGFASISLVSALPLVAMFPAAYALIVTTRLKRVDRRLLFAAWLWFGGFAYAYAIGIFAGNLLPATYTFVEFVLPLCVGLWAAASRETIPLFYERFASVLLAVAAVLGAYAFYQFASPPPWDLAWMEQTKYVSIGIAAPFQFRPFSTMNAPGPFGDLLAAAILFNLPRMRGANVLRIAQLAIAVAALALTMVRSEWIAVAVGAVAYTVLSPGKFRNLSIMGVLALVVIVFSANASTLLGSSQAGYDVQRRFETFTDLDADTSYRERERYFGQALTTAETTPTGAGLGVLGTAAKLGAAGATVDFDNGYIARFTEMGYFGLACYLATMLFAFALAVARWRAVSRAGSRDEAALAAACVSVQAALLFLDLSSDHHNALNGLFFWLAVVMSVPARAA